MLMATALTGILFTSGVGISHAETPDATSTQQVEQTTKYSSAVMEAVRETLGVDKHSTELDDQISTMRKVDVMDRYLQSFGKKLKGKEVREVVQAIFGADLNMISENNYGSKLSSYDAFIMEGVRESLNIDASSIELDEKIMSMEKNEVMDRYIEVHDYSLTGAENRVLINKVFGVNLDGISGIEHGRISIYSKGQWILQNDTDLIRLISSNDDVEITVEPTDFFIQSTGSTQLPDTLIQKLTNLGYTHVEGTNAYYYKNPTGESIPDALKGQTMGAIITTIQTQYSNL